MLRFPSPRMAGFALLAVAPALLGACATVSSGDDTLVAELPPSQAPTYVDLLEFARAADLVAIVGVDQQIAFSPERAPDVAPANVRLYIEGLTQSLLTAPTGVGQTLTFTADRPRGEDGDPPELERRSFIVFADLVPGRPGELQLVSSDAMVPAGPIIEARTRQVLSQLAATDSPPAVTGLRDVISVPGNLAGESETQMFVETASGAPVSLSVVRRPSMRPEWGVSLGEIVDASARPPEPETLTWYRLACSLPRDLPSDSFLQSDAAARAQAREDYALILSELGPCERRYTTAR